MVKEFSNISLSELIDMQNTSQSHEKIIVRFTADWCGPCSKIKPIIENYRDKLSNNIKLITIDIEETLDLYSSLKRYKSVNGIPAILVFNGGPREHWYISDYSILGGKVKEVTDLFEKLSIQ